jgi:hypothetical protein
VCGTVRLREEDVFVLPLEIHVNQLGAVAAGEDHFQVRPFQHEPVRELPAGDGVWHDDIGEQQIDLVAVCGPDFQGALAVRRGEDAVAEMAERPADKFAERVLVLDEEDGDFFAVRRGRGCDDG